MESANGKDEAGTARSEAIDIDLITHAYRSLSDPSAFDALVDAWNYKLEQVDSLSNNRLPVLAAPLLTHLDQLADFARTTQTGIPDDPIRMAVERDESAAMVQTSDGRIVATNDAGEHLFGAATGSIDPLHWLDPTSCQDLEAVRRTVMGRGNRHRAILKIAPVGPDNLPAGTALAEASILHVPAADRGMLVIRSLALPWTAAVIPALQQPFQLTDAETDIARLFYQHRDLAEVARIRGVSLQTVRTQIKTILQKTECDGQAALLHLVTLLCARVRAEVPGAETGWLDPLGTAETIVRPCGARMTYSSVGAANGIPALWVHGPGFNYLLPQAMVEALRVAGIRLLMPHRPGHGNSEAAPGIDPIEDQVSALTDLATALNLRDCPAVGTTCGATALLLARDRMPERIGGVLAIGHFWALEAAELAALPTVHRTFFKLARHAPAILYTIAAVGWRIIQKFGPDWYMERAHTYSERNRRSMRDPEVLALLRADCAMLLAQGHQAFVNDMLLAQAATSDAIERATRPTLWMIGSCDQHYSRDRVLARRARHAGLTVHIIDGASELMLYQRPELIAAALSSLARGEPFTQPDTPSTAGAER